MNAYKINIDISGEFTSVYRSDGWSIPLSDPANSDFQKFKADLAEGVELQDPDGNVMTQEQVNEFLQTIP